MNYLGHLRMEQINLAPAQEWEDASRSWRFIRIGRGAGYWLDQDHPRPLNEGEVVVAAPELKALVRASQLNEVVLHWFKFQPDLLCGFFTLPERDLVEHQGAGRRTQFLPSTHPLARFFGDLAQGSPKPDLARRAEVLGLVAAFFGESLPADLRQVWHPASAQERFQQVVSQMPDLELMQRTPKELAQLCHCSPRHFSRLFREHFGEALRIRRTQLRLLKASQLLASTGETVTEVARDTGFHSVSLFNSLFKRRYGLSPSEFRNQPSDRESKP